MATAITSVVPFHIGEGDGKAVKWAAWLSKTSLDPSSAYRYGLLFAENELEQEDAALFDHEFLLSMGVSIAKHRLEILKLAHKDHRSRHPPPPRPVARLLSAAANARRRLTRCLRSFRGAAFRSSSGVAAPPRSLFAGGRIWASAPAKWGRSKTGAPKTGMKMITDGSEMRWDSMFQDLRPT